MLILPVLGVEQGWLPTLDSNVGLRIYFVHLPILLVVISLVYSATRYDEWRHILPEAVRWGAKLLAFLVAVGVVLLIIVSIPSFWS